MEIRQFKEKQKYAYKQGRRLGKKKKSRQEVFGIGDRNQQGH